jgi:phage tail sheath protein FI
MPVNPTFPGVYVEEVSSGVRTIVGVATSVAAFVDRFRRGPQDEAVEVLSFGDFERDFGGLDTTSEASHAIQQFFLNGGSDAWVVRVGTGLVAASRVLPSGANQAVRVRAGRRVRGAAVPDPGTWGNALRFEVDYDTVQLPNATVDPDNVLTQGELFNLPVSETEVRDGRTFVRQTETYRNLTLRPGVRTHAIETVNAASRLVQLDRTGLAPADPLALPPFRPDPTGTVGVALPGAIPASPLALDLTLDADGPGGVVSIAINGLTVPHTAAPGDPLAVLRPFLESALRAAANNAAVTATPQLRAEVAPLLAGATVQVIGNRFRILLGRGGVNFNPAATLAIAGGSAAALGLSGAGVVVGPQQYAPNATPPNTLGKDSGALTDAALKGVDASRTGMFALRDVDLFNILCLPAAAELAPTAMRSVYAAAEAFCEERRAFLIVDIPRSTASPDAMQTWLSDNATLRHRNAAVYFPRVRVPDPLNQGRLESRAASGTLAGLYAATDAARGVWKAPAGTDVRLRNVQDLDYVLSDAENGGLNPLGANALRSFPIFGFVSWGARTLDGADQQASEWKYIPVRRFALFLEESLFRATKWVVFELNDEPLWAQIRLNIGAFLHGLFRQGAFQGRTPREAYFVKCDRETTTQTDINLGIVNILVGFAPLKPAEFVIIKIQQIAGQIPT